MRQPFLQLHIMSYSIHEDPVFNRPVLPLVDCSVLTAPPREICDEFTGLSAEVRLNFISHPRNRRCFEDAFFDLKDAIRHWDFADGGVLMVPVLCMAGVHRSVAMAEGLAKVISNWEAAPFRLEVLVQHLDLWDYVMNQRHKCGENWRRYLSLRDKVNEAHTTILLANDGTIYRTYVQGAAVSMDWWTSDSRYDELTM